MSQERATNGEWGAWRDAWLAEAPGAGAADAPQAGGSADAAAGPAADRSALRPAPRRPGVARRGAAEVGGGAGADAVSDLLRRLRRQRLRMLATAACEILLLLLLVAATVAVLHGGATAWKVVWMITLWVFTCVAFVFAWWNRRSTWRAAGSAVEDAVRLARLRAERQLRAADFVLLLYAVEAAAVLGQLAWFGRLVPAAVLALAAFGVVIAGWYALVRRRLRRELGRIDAFVRDALA